MGITVSACCCTGTALYYKPGMLSGGILEHECSKQRGIGYFLEPLMMLAPFTKLPLKITLRGVTCGPHDPLVTSVHDNIDFQRIEEDLSYAMCLFSSLSSFFRNHSERKLGYKFC